jgi:hypothetical protein
MAKEVEWEEQFYAAGCDWAKRATEAFFTELDERLYALRPVGWCVVGFRERCLVTRYGEVQLRRRLYQDEAGASHFLVDEYLDLPAQQAATPSLQSAVVGLAGEIGFVKVAQHVAALTAAVLSPTTVWRLTERVGAAALGQEAEEGEAVYGQGQRPVQEGRREAERLFVEADGVLVRLQRAAESHLEIKSAIACRRSGSDLKIAARAGLLTEPAVFINGCAPSACPSNLKQSLVIPPISEAVVASVDSCRSVAKKLRAI